MTEWTPGRQRLTADLLVSTLSSKSYIGIVDSPEAWVVNRVDSWKRRGASPAVILSILHKASDALHART